MKKGDDILKVFFQMEEECKLFDLKSDNNPIWDILRAPIYYLYYFPETAIDSSSNFNLTYLVGMFKIFIISIYRLIKTRGDNIVLTNSRYVDDKGYYYDKVSSDIINHLSDKLILEYESPIFQYRYSLVSEYSSIITYLVKLNKVISEEVYHQIEVSLVKYFGESKISHTYVNEIYNQFLLKYHVFKFIFKIKKTRRFFYVQNGFQKGYIKAARELNIRIFELQHGSFDQNHLGYSYPNFIDNKSNIFFPDYLLTLGAYWGQNMNIPVTEILPIGNNEFYSKLHNLPDKDDIENFILVISSIIHADELLPLTKQLSIEYPQKQICFKLHVNEYSNYDRYINFFLDCKNITVVRGEKLISELFLFSDLVIVIASTVVYEALNINKKVAIYKKVNFESQRNIFKLANVYLFDEISELNSILIEPTLKANTMFFAPFDNTMFFEILDK